jgi:hypothetical protein
MFCRLLPLENPCGGRIGGWAVMQASAWQSMHTEGGVISPSQLVSIAMAMETSRKI